jgi:hypothetical protein
MTTCDKWPHHRNIEVESSHIEIDTIFTNKI